MRKKMTVGHPNQSTDFDLKHDAGGMVDLEFATQYLVLTQSKAHPELIRNLGNIALLGLAADAGLIDQGLAQRAADAYRDLRRRQHEVRLQGAERARVPPAELQEARAAVRELWETVLGQ